MAKNRNAVNRRNTAGLFDAVSDLIDSSRKRVATVVNTELVLLNWQIGKCINDNILQHNRAGYGDAVIELLAKRLADKYGSGWSVRQLWTVTRCAAIFSEKQILHALRAELGWTHIRILSSIEDTLKCRFYFEMCVHEKWSTRQLQERLNALLYERTAISKKPAKLVKRELDILRKEGPATEELVFKDPYVLDFLGLQDVYSEKDLESAIIVELQKFIIELGSDFAFIARQKRIVVDGEDCHMDLLFYHRRLSRLVVIDLKLDKFKAAHKGQMELYLRWLEKHEMREGEQPPIGLILCAGKSDEHVELLMLHEERIKVARYLTALPSKEVLKKRLQEAIKIARQREMHNASRSSKKKQKELGDMLF
jgi:predicted nuclease of restriction endonuclease-like (RecB) superfamily